jgi:hypothetical protein
MMKKVGAVGRCIYSHILTEVGNIMETAFFNPLLMEVVALSQSSPLIY